MAEENARKRHRFENEVSIGEDLNIREKEEEEDTNIEDNIDEEMNEDDHVKEANNNIDDDERSNNNKENQYEEIQNNNDDNTNENIEDLEIDNNDDDIAADDEIDDADDDEIDDYDYPTDYLSDYYSRDGGNVYNAIYKVKSLKTILKLIKLFPNELTSKEHYHGRGYLLHSELCHGNREDVVMKLIELFPEAVELEDNEGYFPLQLAIEYYKSEDVVMKLLEVYPRAVRKISTKNGGVTALSVAIGHNLPETIITKLIELHPLDIQRDDCEGVYPIHCAIRTDRSIAVIKFLLDGDPLGMQRRVNGYSSNDNLTPFHFACQHNNPVLVKYLIQRSDLQINVRDCDRGQTPLHMACMRINDKIIDLLLNHPDMDVNATDNDNDTPIHKIVKHFGTPCDHLEKCIEILQKLLDNPCILINLKDNKGKTPLDVMKARKDRLDLLEKCNQLNSHQEVELDCVRKIIYLLEDFPIKRKWKAYCYHYKDFMDL